MKTTNGILAALLLCVFGFGAFAQEAEVSLAERVARIAEHEHGESRADMVALTEAARAGDDALRAELEALYVALLAAPHTDAAREFVLREMLVVGTANSIPALEWMLATTQPPFETPLIEALIAVGSREVADKRWTRQFDHTTSASTVAWRREFMRAIAPVSARARAQARLEAALEQLPSASPMDAQRDGWSLATALLLFDELRGAKLHGDPLGEHLVELALEPRVEANDEQRVAALSAAFERGATPQVRGRALRGLAERVPDTFAELLANELGARPAPEAAELLEVVAAEGLAAAVEGDFARALSAVVAHADVLGTQARDVLTGRRSNDLDATLAGWIGESGRDDAQRAALLDVLVARGGDGWRTVADASTSGERPLLAAAALRALAGVADKRALGHVTAALGDPRIQVAALDALGRWTSVDVFPVLERFVTGETGEKRDAAFASALALVRNNVARERDAASALLVKLAENCQDGEQWNAWIEVAGNVPTRECADVLLGLCADPFRIETAGAAALRVARGLRTREPDVVRRIASELLARTDNAQLVRGAKAELDALEANEDFLLAWRIAGPFTKDGVKGQDILEEVFLPETEPDSAAILWRDFFATGTDDRGTFDLEKLIGGENCTAYARTNIWSETAQRVRLEFGSDDSLCVWFGGREVLRNDVQRGLSRASDVVEVDLVAGWNELMLEVGQGGGGWAFCARLRATDGTPASGWHCDRIQRQREPRGAKVLLDERAMEFVHSDGRPIEWRHENGVLQCVPGSGDIVSKAAHGDCSLHVEFRVPNEPHLSNGQGRGNSGVYLQGRYEVQILNSFGEPPRIDECGSIYGVAEPRVQASLRPGEWQTYDIEFTAARWKDGTKVTDARLTVFHNGVLVHDDVHVGGSTGAGSPEEQGVAPLRIQDHGHALEFRNVWLIDHDAAATPGKTRQVDGKKLGRRLGGEALYAFEDGAIVGRSVPNQPNTFLVAFEEVGDFRLDFEAKQHPELNSGVQIRSHVHPDVSDGRVFGYQVELDPSPRGYTAGIYEEGRRGWLFDLSNEPVAHAAFRRDEWNTVRVVARGDVIRTWINGVPAAVLVDGANADGFIGLQVHGVGDRRDPLEIRWRNFALTDL
jgi:hypothetical protein